ncbi:hypothetical protein FACS1894172_15590 [Spirochaetia bacterium]|nr:hypothetical protein FACS1894164_04160 [Spirochaetia bacterium]GHU34794.1 hypothetical protein FACS1894172_15590 [Spirochaetia bacterium]
MGFGLGKNSPVKVSLSRENYEAMIDRHGQWVRWRIAKKCPCVTDSNQPDIHCEKCHGSGEVYDVQKDYQNTVSVTYSDGIITLPEEYSNATILKVYDHNNTVYEFRQFGRYAEVLNSKALIRGELVDVLFEDSLTGMLEQTDLTLIGHGVYRVHGIEAPPSKLAGVYYRAKGDVLHIDRVEDTEGNEYPIVGYRQDTVHVATHENKPVLTGITIEYIRPSRFFVLSQNLDKADAALVLAAQGDAMSTIPYYCNVSIDDVITVLSGTHTDKRVITHAGNIDRLPEFFVERVESVETKAELYREQEDFILIRNNEMEWIGERQPHEQEAMAITYRYFPTYRVVKNFPMLRTSEDQRMPRKVALKLFSAFNESRGVQKNG